MVRRHELHELLEAICPNVYFQPPASIQMAYPAILYNRDRAQQDYADNIPYLFVQKYELILISKEPDDAKFAQLAALTGCRHQRYYAADNLNHDVFTLHF